MGYMGFKLERGYPPIDGVIYNKLSTLIDRIKCTHPDLVLEGVESGRTGIIGIEPDVNFWYVVETRQLTPSDIAEIINDRVN